MILAICNNSSILSVFLLIKNILNIISIVVPIILIFLLVIDFLKIIKEDEKGMKKSFNSLVIRLVAASVILLMPLFVDLAMSVIGESNAKDGQCWKKATIDNIRVLKAKEEAEKRYKKIMKDNALEEYRLNKKYQLDVRSGIEARNRKETGELLSQVIESEIGDYVDPYARYQSGAGVIGDDGIVRYFQTDYKAFPYGSYGNISSHGCGPTSAAVVAATLKKNTSITPITATAGVCSAGGCSSSGSSWAGVNAYLRSQGIKYEAGSMASFTESGLRNIFNSGKMVIVLVGPGYFTRGGHYFVLYGLDNNGKVKIVQVSNKKQTAKTWAVSDIKASLRSYYSYSL